METQIITLTKENFKAFGRIVDIPESSPTKMGEGWECWNYIQMMDVDTKVGMGLVNSHERPFVIDSMERHDSREELLIAIGQDIIQPVASTENLNDPNEKPKAENVLCFHLKKGQGIILNKGVWHSPAYPADQSTSYFFAIEKKPDKYGDEIVNPWVEFHNAAKVRFYF
ncbi:ureidoglycolate lyase [Pseudalkalibacillus sp. A8]|uniref:ureidoglycolate lyase n=1 Tax=Pseudalkalibacillus sp. A8 TaxID=3382641 RepID=UPI0038B42D6E